VERQRREMKGGRERRRQETLETPVRAQGNPTPFLFSNWKGGEGKVQEYHIDLKCWS